jgi:hypothetical protein
VRITLRVGPSPWPTQTKSAERTVLRRCPRACGRSRRGANARLEAKIAPVPLAKSPAGGYEVRMRRERWRHAALAKSTEPIFLGGETEGEDERSSFPEVRAAGVPFGRRPKRGREAPPTRETSASRPRAATMARDARNRISTSPQAQVAATPAAGTTPGQTSAGRH